MIALRHLIAAAAVALATPALADPAMLRVIAGGMVMGDQPLLRGYAWCMLGNGNPDELRGLLTEAGFAEDHDGEMGVTYYTSSDMPFGITTYMDGEICDVTSETVGTTEALGALVVIAGTVGFGTLSGDCETMLLAGTVRTELTSSGNDPVCTSETSSNVRFTFGASALDQ